MKRCYVSNLHDGLKFEDVFRISWKSVSKARNGSQYLRLRLADRTGEIDAVKWEASQSEIDKINENDYVLVQGSVRTFNDKLQVNVESMQRHPDGVDAADFMACSDRNSEDMLRELSSILSEISNPHLKALMDRFFSDDSFVSKFKQAPAAEKNHHAYIGGLLEHTLSVTRTCRELANLYPQIDRDLLIAGAVLHDIGKTEEFSWNGIIKYTERGVMVGHLVGGAMMVKAAAESIPDFDPLLSTLLQHMIISHHGNFDWGSPKLPCTLEAYALHIADDLDAKIGMFEQAIRESDESGEPGVFTRRHHLLNRHIYRGIRNSSQPEDKKSQASNELDLDMFSIDFDPFDVD